MTVPSQVLGELIRRYANLILEIYGVIDNVDLLRRHDAGLDPAAFRRLGHCDVACGERIQRSLYPSEQASPQWILERTRCIRLDDQYLYWNSS
jgi:hypothetical protein